MTTEDPWARYGWLLWAPWLVFLAFPLTGSWQADVGPELRAAGVALTLLFGATYAIATARLGRCDGVHLGSLSESALALAALVSLAGATVPTLGVESLGFLPFIQAFAMFALPRPANWVVTGTVLVGTVAGLVMAGDFAQWGFFAFILFAVTLGTGAGRAMEEQGREYAAVRERLTVSAERERVARDVHDVLGHSLTVVSVKADLAARLVETDPDRARTELADIQRLSRQALAEIRATVGGLRAARLGEELGSAREALEGAGIEPVLPADEQVVDPRYRPVVGWVLREAVTNVVRHSAARRCEVVLGPSTLVVRDDGRGVSGAPEGHGLQGVRERVEGTGGRLRVEAGPGSAGTCLEVTW